MHTYRVAQRLLAIDPSLPEMASLRVDGIDGIAGSALEEARGPERAPQAESLAEDVFRGDGQLGTVRRHIECRWSPRGYSLRVDGVGSFRISDDGRRISRCDAPSPDAQPPGQLTETVLGPAMTLALALQGVWCLHAGAVECGGEVIAFLGRSGAGKSTLARELPRIDAAKSDGMPARRGPLRCAADDVLPVALEDSPDAQTVVALPRFPQLKYPLDRQPGDQLPPRLPLRRIYVLAPSEDLEAAPSAEPLSATTAVLALIRHTVAAKLFTKDLLTRHMHFAARLAERVEIFRLSYPHHPPVLRRVWQLVVPRPSTPHLAVPSDSVPSPAVSPVPRAG